MGLLRISESVRAYAYLVLSSQPSKRSWIIESTTSALTAQQAFQNNFEDMVNRSVDIREEIKRYQEILSYALSKADYSVGENIYTLPGDLNLNIRSGTVGYNKKNLVSDENFSLGENDKVNTLQLVKSHKVVLKPTITHKNLAQELLLHRNKLSLTKRKLKFPLFFTCWSLRNMVCFSIKKKTKPS